jgi:hypothetical protein
MALRPQLYVLDVSQKYPGIWDHFEAYRKQLKAFRGGWPSWCFCPDYTGVPVIRNLLGTEASEPTLEEVGMGERISILATWRMTQGVYRFDSTVLDEVWDTPVTGNLPAELLLKLPEWCIYVETPGKVFEGVPMYGFFAKLNCGDQTPSLTLFIDLDVGNGIVTLPLNDLTIEDSMRHFAAVTAEENPGDDLLSHIDRYAFSVNMGRLLAPLVSSVLYICSEASDITHSRHPNQSPGNPTPRKTKKGRVLLAAGHPNVWQVGYRIGPRLRQAGSRRASDSLGGKHSSPRSHIRRAHWHSYWVGSRQDPVGRKLEVRWLHPVLVNVAQTEDLVNTVRQVG